MGLDPNQQVTLQNCDASSNYGYFFFSHVAAIHILATALLAKPRLPNTRSSRGLADVNSSIHAWQLTLRCLLLAQLCFAAACCCQELNKWMGATVVVMTLLRILGAPDHRLPISLLRSPPSISTLKESTSTAAAEMLPPTDANAVASSTNTTSASAAYAGSICEEPGCGTSGKSEEVSFAMELQFA